MSFVRCLACIVIFSGCLSGCVSRDIDRHRADVEREIESLESLSEARTLTSDESGRKYELERSAEDLDRLATASRIASAREISSTVGHWLSYLAPLAGLSGVPVIATLLSGVGALLRRAKS